MISLQISAEYAIIIYNAVRCWNWPWRYECMDQMLCRMAEHFFVYSASDELYRSRLLGEDQGWFAQVYLLLLFGQLYKKAGLVLPFKDIAAAVERGRTGYFHLIWFAFYIRYLVRHKRSKLVASRIRQTGWWISFWDEVIRNSKRTRKKSWIDRNQIGAPRFAWKRLL